MLLLLCSSVVDLGQILTVSFLLTFICVNRVEPLASRGRHKARQCPSFIPYALQLHMFLVESCDSHYNKARPCQPETPIRCCSCCCSSVPAGSIPRLGSSQQELQEGLFLLVKICASLFIVCSSVSAWHLWRTVMPLWWCALCFPLLWGWSSDQGLAASTGGRG